MQSHRLSILALGVALAGSAAASSPVIHLETASHRPAHVVGAIPDAFVSSPALSADGRWMAFFSYAENLIGHEGMVWPSSRVFLRDRLLGGTYPIPLQLPPIFGPARLYRDMRLSADGRWLALRVTDFTVDDYYPTQAMIVDVASGEILASGDTSLGFGGPGFGADFSSDGRWLVFDASDHDPETGSFLHYVSLLDRNSPGLIPIAGGSQGAGTPGASSMQPSISDDGRFIVFSSDDAALLGGEPALFDYSQILLLDRQSGEFELISHNAQGLPGNGGSVQPRISGDGTYIAYLSYASDLPGGDLGTLPPSLIVINRESREVLHTLRLSSNFFFDRSIELDRNGQGLAFLSSRNHWVPGDTDGDTDLFHLDLISGQISALGSSGDSPMPYEGFALRDGHAVFVQDTEDLLGEGPWSELRHAVVGVEGSTVEGLTDNDAAYPAPGYGDCSLANPALSADGRQMLFVSDAVLSTTPASGWHKLYLRDRLTDQTQLVADDVTPDQLGLDHDGRTAVFTADSLALTGNGVSAVFAYDALLDQIERVSQNTQAQPADGPSDSPSLSSDGNVIAFRSAAGNLHASGGSASALYVHHRDSGQTGLLTRTPQDQAAQGEHRDPVVSGDGRYVVLLSDSTELGPQDGNALLDVYRVDLSDQSVELVSVDDALQATGSAALRPLVSDDGRYVVYVAPQGSSPAANGSRVMLRDLDTGTTTFALAGPLGGIVPDSIVPRTLSADAQQMLFTADVQSAGVSRAYSGAFVADLATGAFRVASTDRAGNTALDGAHIATASTLSRDGSTVAFCSERPVLEIDAGIQGVGGSTLVASLAPDRERIHANGLDD